jgi:hypothetical protein
MATSLGEILATLQNGVSAVRDLKSALNNIFPQATAVSTSAATAGTVTFTSSQAVAFLTIETSSGGLYKVPLYS